MSDLRMELIQGQLNDIEENVRSIKATWGNTIMTLDNIKSSLKADRQKAIEEAYKRGLDDAWECARRLVWETSLNEAEHMGFIAKEESAEILRDYTVTAAMKAVELYDKKLKAEIKVGDEAKNTLRLMDNAVGYVIGTTIEGDYNVSRYIDGKIKTGTWRRENCIKTGRHSDAVVQLLAEMEGEQRSCSTCKHNRSGHVQCIECKGYSRWEPKEGAE